MNKTFFVCVLISVILLQCISSAPLKKKHSKSADKTRSDVDTAVNSLQTMKNELEEDKFEDNDDDFNVHSKGETKKLFQEIDKR